LSTNINGVQFLYFLLESEEVPAELLNCFCIGIQHEHVVQVFRHFGYLGFETEMVFG